MNPSGLILPEKPSLLILASGSGSTAQRVIEETQGGALHANVSHVITNNSDAGVIDRVAELNDRFGLDIGVSHVSGATHPGGAGEKGQQTLEESEEIRRIAVSHDIGLILLLGYMKEVRGSLLEEFGWRPDMGSPYLSRMLNTHPGLLPATAGLYGIHVQEFALDQGHEYAGQTLHVVARDYDTGPKIAENKVLILPDHTPQTLFDDVQVVEKENIGPDIQGFIDQQAALAA